MRLTRSVQSLILYALTFIVLCAAQTVFAQTTLIAYQGNLDFDGVPASGNYDFQFRVFDAASGGAQQGVHDEHLNVTVTNGAYTVNIDFGATPFINSSADRFLEVSVRATGSSTYTALTPRQQLTTTPYSIRSIVATTAHGLDATCISCVTSGQIQNVQGSQVTGNVAGSQISGPIPVASVPPGSFSYIQNTTNQQIGQFNIGGSGTVGGTLSGNLVNATTQYNLNGKRLLSSSPVTGNVFVGINAGNANTTGKLNSFFGHNAGLSNTMGQSNSFFGANAGILNTTGESNSFFGDGAGLLNTTGSSNSFFGDGAGELNTTSFYSSFFGSGAGYSNTTGSQNSFFGYIAGGKNATGAYNTFIGIGADFDTPNATGLYNTLLGSAAMVTSGVNYSTAIGAKAEATASNTIVLGTKLETVIVRGKLQVDLLGAAGSQQVCMNNSSRLASCSSSLRYKTDLLPFSGGLALINRLQPISFTWKDGGMRDLGFGAEDVHKIEPLLVTYNAQGLVEGVKYDRISALLVNALKEQQQQIAAQQIQIEELTAIKTDNAELRARLAGILARLEQLEIAKAGQK